MSIKQVQIRAQDLTLGMYVSGLDRPWSQTPFPLQGFQIKQPKDIEVLKSYCTYVYIDVTKGKGPVKPSDVISTVSKSSTQQVVKNKPKPLAFRLEDSVSGTNQQRIIKPSPIEVRRGVYETTTSVRLEAIQAERIVRELKGHLTVVTKMIAKGRQVDYQALRNVSDSMVASVLRCPDAFAWLMRLRQKDQHSHDHSLRSALWAVQFARFAGMPKDQIEILCLGTLLKDVGKVKLASALLRNELRTKQEEAEYRKFVDYGVEALRSAGSFEPKVISVVRYHCERMDGSGFPQGVTGNKIPLLARIAGIATEYDAISNPRATSEPVAPSKAVSVLYNLRDTAFQEDLVVKFIQSVGLYPTGTVVELSSGDLGVILEQHPKSRLTPTIAVLDAKSGDLNDNCIILDLKNEEESREKLVAAGHVNASKVVKLAIARDLEPTGYDIDFDKISNCFLTEATEEKVKTGFMASLKQKILGV